MTDSDDDRETYNTLADCLYDYPELQGLVRLFLLLVTNPKPRNPLGISRRGPFWFSEPPLDGWL